MNCKQCGVEYTRPHRTYYCPKCATSTQKLLRCQRKRVANGLCRACNNPQGWLKGYCNDHAAKAYARRGIVTPQKHSMAAQAKAEIISRVARLITGGKSKRAACVEVAKDYIFAPETIKNWYYKHMRGV